MCLLRVLTVQALWFCWCTNVVVRILGPRAAEGLNWVGFNTSRKRFFQVKCCAFHHWLWRWAVEVDLGVLGLVGYLSISSWPGRVLTGSFQSCRVVLHSRPYIYCYRKKPIYYLHLLCVFLLVYAHGFLELRFSFLV